VYEYVSNNFSSTFHLISFFTPILVNNIFRSWDIYYSSSIYFGHNINFTVNRAWRFLKCNTKSLKTNHCLRSWYFSFVRHFFKYVVYYPFFLWKTNLTLNVLKIGFCLYLFHSHQIMTIHLSFKSIIRPNSIFKMLQSWPINGS